MLRLLTAMLLIGVIAVACADDDEDEVVGDREVSTEEPIDIGDNLQEEEEQEGDLPEAPEEPFEEATEAASQEDDDEAEDADADEPAEADSENPDLPQDVTNVAVADILSTPEEYTDTEVVVDGTVAQIIADGAFIVADDEGGEQTILVAGAGDAFPELDEGSSVSVVGMVTTFDVNDDRLNDLIEAGDAEQLDAVLAEYEDQPYLAASHVLFSDVSVRDLIEDGQAFVDQTVTVTGPIVELSEEGAFLMGFPINGENLLVIDTQEEREDDLELNDLVQVTGTVRPADPSLLLDEYGVDLGVDAFGQFEGDTMIVADEVTVADESS